jgi:hypothetical protein
VNAPGTLLNTTTADTVSYVDVLPDSSLVDNELLYTEGGVAPNVPAPNAALVEAFRGYVFCRASERPNELVYSKAALPGRGVAFADVFTVRLDPSETIEALAVLDERLVVFTAGNEGSAFRLPGLSQARAEALRDGVLRARGRDVV